MSFQITTAGITSPSASFVLRMPTALAEQLNLSQGCQFTLKAGPMGRFNASAQPSAYFASDLTIPSCPAPKPVGVLTASLTQLTLTFDRILDPESVTNAAEQFTFNGGLSATAAQMNGRQVVLTTSTQTAGAEYTLTVASSVKDTRITEVHPNIPSSVDLVELVAVSAGLVEGFVLQQDPVSPTPLATFPEVAVLAGDIIVVHLNPPTSMTASETTAKNQFPKSGTPSNYDMAWDFKGGTTGIAYSSRVLLVKDALGTIQDAIPFASGTAPNDFPTHLQAIQNAGLWLPANCGGAPCTGSSSPTAAQVSANWTGSATTPTGNSVRRISATDTDTRNDWAVGAQSFGAPNP